jgi:hypothetical protein
MQITRLARPTFNRVGSAGFHECGGGVGVGSHATHAARRTTTHDGVAQQSLPWFSRR